MEGSKARLVFLVFVVLTVVLIITNIFFYQKLQDVRRQGAPQVAEQEEAREVIAEVGKLMVLPEEVPTVATVSDLEKLKDQPFFANAQIGDKVLIYAVARKAILYSPSEHKIVEVAPLLIGESNPAAPTIPETTTP